VATRITTITKIRTQLVLVVFVNVVMFVVAAVGSSRSSCYSW